MGHVLTDLTVQIKQRKQQLYIVYYANMAATSKQKIKFKKHTSKPMQYCKKTKKLHNIQD